MSMRTFTVTPAPHVSGTEGERRRRAEPRRTRRLQPAGLCSTGWANVAGAGLRFAVPGYSMGSFLGEGS